MSSLPHRRGLLPALLLFAVAAGCGPEGTSTTPPSPPRVTVGHPLVQKVVDEDDYNGWLQASQTVDVRARVRGHIQKIDFQDGDRVEKGQLLFELDPRPFEAAIESGLAQAKAIAAQRDVAQRDVARYEELIKAKAVSQQELDKTRAEADSYAAQYNAKMQDVETSRLDLEYSKIKAEISGRIGRAMLTVGNLVNAGGTDPVLATIVDTYPMHAYFDIDERSLQRYQQTHKPPEGKPAVSLRELKIPFRYGLDNDDGYPREGTLDFIDVKVNPGTGTIPVRGVVANDKFELAAGSRIRVRLPVSEPYEATLVPDTAVNNDQDQKYLLMVGDKNVVQRRNVRLGRLLDGGKRIVLSADPPLKSDEWIITDGMQRARVLYPVDPVPEPAAGK